MENSTVGIQRLPSPQLSKFLDSLLSLGGDACTEWVAVSASPQALYVEEESHVDPDRKSVVLFHSESPDTAFSPGVVNMCGIVGYVGHRDVTEFLVEGLRRLEYRGYDSAGIAVSRGNSIHVCKRAGRVTEVAHVLEGESVEGKLGIGHTRWATHGPPTDVNSHPHVGGNGQVVLVHNGVIENYTTLRSQLQALGYVFHTATDTEVVAHLIAHHFEEQLKLGSDPNDVETCVRSVEASLQRLKGTYGLAIIFRDFPELLIGARNESAGSGNRQG